MIPPSPSIQEYFQEKIEGFFEKALQFHKQIFSRNFCKRFLDFTKKSNFLQVKIA